MSTLSFGPFRGRFAYPAFCYPFNLNIFSVSLNQPDSVNHGCRYICRGFPRAGMTNFFPRLLPIQHAFTSRFFARRPSIPAGLGHAPPVMTVSPATSQQTESHRDAVVAYCRSARLSVAGNNTFRIGLNPNAHPGQSSATAPPGPIP